MNTSIVRKPGGVAAKLASAVVLLAIASPSYAYVDPGTGAMLLQMAIATFAGVLFYFRSAVGRVASWFSGARGKENVTTSDERRQQEQ